MLISIYSSKGGSGCSTASVLVASVIRNQDKTLLIDANAGDLHPLVGADETNQYCFDDWCNSKEPTPESLIHISTSLDRNLNFVSGVSFPRPAQKSVENPIQLSYEKRQQVTAAISQSSPIVVVDIGTRSDALAHDIIEASDVVIVALRRCYLSLWRAMNHPFRKASDACVILDESGRSIPTQDMAKALEIDSIIEIAARRDFARIIDAGVLLFRTPKAMTEPIEAFLNEYTNRKNEDIQKTIQDDVEVDHDFWGDDQEHDLRSSAHSLISEKYLKFVNSYMPRRA